MKPKTILANLGLVILLALLISSCGERSASAPEDSLPAQPTTNTAIPVDNTSATLSSLEKVDDYPFYVMHYSGGYDYPEITARLSYRGSFGCALFTSLGETGDKLYGRNFDWEFSPALLVFTDPPDGYASASMVDLTFLGISVSDANSLIDRPLTEREDLLAAPMMPFDGMNEYGLTIGMAAVPDEYIDDTSYDPSRPVIGSIGMIRQILDHARNVNEALEIFGQYNLIFSGGPPIHYLLADPSGKAVLVEFYRGEMVQLPNEGAWHLATNHLRCIAQGDGGCWRYGILSDRLTKSNGQLDAASALQLLSDVKQASTQWSTVYNMTTGEIHVAVGQEYDTSYSFHIDLVKQ